MASTIICQNDNWEHSGAVQNLFRVQNYNLKVLLNYNLFNWTVKLHHRNVNLYHWLQSMFEFQFKPNANRFNIILILIVISDIWCSCYILYVFILRTISFSNMVIFCVTFEKYYCYHVTFYSRFSSRRKFRYISVSIDVVARKFTRESQRAQLGETFVVKESCWGQCV